MPDGVQPGCLIRAAPQGPSPLTAGYLAPGGTPAMRGIAQTNSMATI